MGPESTQDKKIFHAPILMSARQKLLENDDKEIEAACMLQRKWRHLKANKRRASVPHANSTADVGKKRRHNNHMRTSVVTAPMYFGESCLWVPLKEWGSSEVEYMYNVRCESRAEVVVIARDTVKEVLEHFSGWLPQRFENFRQEVVDGLQGHKASSRTVALDVTASTVGATPPSASRGTEPLPIPGRKRASFEDGTPFPMDVAEQVLSSDAGELRQRLANIASRSRAIGLQLGGVPDRPKVAQALIQPLNGSNLAEPLLGGSSSRVHGRRNSTE